MPGISKWLQRDSQPRNLYELLGHPLLDPDREALLASLRSANRELLDYQSHDDRAIAKRAMALIAELGRIRGILEDRAKHQAHDEELIEGLRRDFARDRSAGLVRSEDDLASWLMARHGLDHFFATHVAARVRVEPVQAEPTRPVFVEIVDPAPIPPPPTRPAPPRKRPEKEILSLLPFEKAEPVAPPSRPLGPALLPWAVAAVAIIAAGGACVMAFRQASDAREAERREQKLLSEQKDTLRELSDTRVKLTDAFSASGRHLASLEFQRAETAKKQEELTKKQNDIRRLESELKTLDSCQADLEILKNQLDAFRKEKENGDAALRRYHHAFDLYTDRQNDQALTEVTEAIRLNPKLARALVLRGHLWFARREDNKALQDYDAAVRSDPNDARAWLFRGNFRQSQKNYDQAILDYTEAIRLEPDGALAYTYRGRAYSRLNEFDAALADFTESLRLNPKSAQAYRGRAWAYVLMKDFDKGLRELNQAVQLDPGNGSYHYDKACCFALQKKSDPAFESLQQALDLGYRDFQHMDTDADLDSIRTDPRYKKLLDKYRK